MSLHEEISERFKLEEIVIRPESPEKLKSLQLLYQHYKTLLFNSLPDIDLFFAIKNRIMGFGYYGKNARIRSGFRCSNPQNIYILEESFINYSCTFLANDIIAIGKNVAIGPNVGIYTINHHLNSFEKFIPEKEPVYIEDNSWIGGGSIILPGVKISEGSVIGAGAVVTRSTDKGCLYAGVPAKKIKKVN